MTTIIILSAEDAADPEIVRQKVREALTPEDNGNPLFAGLPPDILVGHIVGGYLSELECRRRIAEVRHDFAAQEGKEMERNVRMKSRQTGTSTLREQAAQAQPPKMSDRERTMGAHLTSMAKEMGLLKGELENYKHALKTARSTTEYWCAELESSKKELVVCRDTNGKLVNESLSLREQLTFAENLARSINQETEIYKTERDVFVRGCDELKQNLADTKNALEHYAAEAQRADQLNKRCSDLSSALDHANTQVAELVRERNAARRQFEENRTHLEEAYTRISDLQNTVITLPARLHATEEELRVAKDAIKKLVGEPKEGVKA